MKHLVSVVFGQLSKLRRCPKSLVMGKENYVEKEKKKSGKSAVNTN